MIGQLAGEFFEEFHRLDQRLSEYEAKPVRVVQFTSSRFGEGVTSVVLAFARYLADAHGSDKVLAVEANLRQPVFCELLDLPAEHSIVSILEGRSSIEDAIYEVPDEGFRVIPGQFGPIKEGGSSLKASPQQMGALINDLRKQFQYILLDTLPAGKVVDSAALSRHADGVIIVVEANVTRQEVLENTIKVLRANRANVVGIVLNKRDLHIPKWLYRFL
jgi:capsular exopolysaccharide synthesis family protein